ncbi:hypothetical protein EB796_004062 [Bugula neritina]|uniref:Uncharacterized protein n=1 Tax=Bugula neritina TaxID=10212 RepID=A0A7J7KHA3_BUGNE|nr:hypothetical protein EB796_004062 [Bugula neritina]
MENPPPTGATVTLCLRIIASPCFGAILIMENTSVLSLGAMFPHPSLPSAPILLAGVSILLSAAIRL